MSAFDRFTGFELVVKLQLVLTPGQNDLHFTGFRFFGNIKIQEKVIGGIHGQLSRQFHPGIINSCTIMTDFISIKLNLEFVDRHLSPPKWRIYHFNLIRQLGHRQNIHRK